MIMKRSGTVKGQIRRKVRNFHTVQDKRSENHFQGTVTVRLRSRFKNERFTVIHFLKNKKK
jgi:hypothetical protein